uniref:Uncharacterized protein n=1 Tax=Rhizophora mucronata TaxID=61149 RepID=A0A2P2R1B9_RHIMU
MAACASTQQHINPCHLLTANMKPRSHSYILS